ncbi:pescadillo-like protein, partial [Tanacetum coccineum]
VPSVESTFVGAKRKSKDIGWEYGVIPDTSNPDRIKCTLCGKLVSGGVTRLKQHIAQITGQTTSCSKATKEDQLKCRNAINEGKMKKQAKRQHDEAIRSEVRLDSSLEDDEVHDHSMKEPSFFGPMDNFANIVNPEQSLERGKGKKVELSNAIRKERMWMTKKYVARWFIICIGALPRFKKILDQAKKLTIFIYSHFKTLAIMRDFIKRKDIVRPGVTRFASSFLTLQSLSEKKEQLRHMFSSTKWEECRFSGTVKGKAAFATVLSTAFWAGVTLCLKVFTPLVKVLRMVDADWKPSMGFVYGEMIKAKEEIKAVLGDNKKAYEPIIKIIEKKMKGRLDTVLHLMAYLLNPYYFYKDTEIQHDPDVSDAVLAFFEIILAGDLDMQLEVTNLEMPKYKNQMDRFGKELEISACEVNNEKYDSANWWGTFGGATPNLKKIAMRILSLTSSSSGCERNWSTFEGIHTKKRNRLEASKLNNLVYVQFNSNLSEKAKRGKARDVEVLLSNDSNMAQEWIVECDGDEEVEVQDQEAQWEVIGEAMEADEYLQPRQSSRTTTKTTQRELFDEEFESGSEEVVYEEGEYESDGAKIIEGCGDKD